MIARVIAWSARNLLLVLFGTGFAAAAGLYALIHLPLDAIPDLSDTQVIVYTEYPGQAPQVIEDQVTYPLATAMLTVPNSKVVRGFSFFGVSFVYIIFEDGTDIYWARSRVLEFLNAATSRLPAGVNPTIGPDATGVGWVYQYAVMSKELNLAETRTIQDWNLKFALAKAEGVAEIASVEQIEQVLKAVPGTSSAYAERSLGGYYLEITPDRGALSRYGLMVQDVQDAIATALGGQTVTTTVEGRQRFAVNMRYPRDLRDNPKSVGSDVLVPMPAGGAVPLGEVAAVELARGPSSIRTENGQLATYIYVDIRDRDLGDYVADPQRSVQASVQFPPGYYVMWSGQYEYLERATARLKIVIPVTLLIIFLLLYLNFRSITETMIVMLSLPFALVGGLWLMWWLGFNLSVAVAVGFILVKGFRLPSDDRKHLSPSSKPVKRPQRIPEPAE